VDNSPERNQADETFIMNTRISLLKRKMSGVELSKQLNMSQSSLSQYLNGYRPIPDSIKEQIDAILLTK